MTTDNALYVSKAAIKQLDGAELDGFQISVREDRQEQRRRDPYQVRSPFPQYRGSCRSDCTASSTRGGISLTGTLARPNCLATGE